MVSFRGQKKLGLRPDWSPLGVYFKIYDEYPHPFHMRIPPPPPLGYEGTFMVVSHAFHPQKSVALCFEGAPGLWRIFCCNKMEKICYCMDYVCTTNKHICKVLQVKTMTEGYDDRSP